MSGGRRKSTAWFDAGAAAFARVAPDLPRGYACPLCTGVFGRDELDKLTLEHVPPASLGGRRLVLTCFPCNSLVGAPLDADARRREHVLDFQLATMERPLRAVLVQAGARVNVDVQITGKSILVNVLPGQNAPGAIQGWEAAMERMVRAGRWEGESVRLTLDATYRHRQSLVSLLRAAYLAAFAALGYSYIFRPSLRMVRAQLARPGESILRVFHATVPDAAPAERRMLFVDLPEKFHALLVQMGRHIVYLPGAGPYDGLYERLEHEREVAPRFSESLIGRGVPWPTRPTYGFVSSQAEAQPGA